jgi:branched-chain amino acid transport system substrate-binding protein
MRRCIMRKPKINIVLLLVALAIGIIFLPNLTYAQKAGEKNWVTFGVLCPMTGPVARFGPYMRNSAELAAQEVNTKWNPPHGGLIIKGKRYYLRYELYDDEVDPAKSAAGFRKLVEMYNVPFVIGPLGSPQAWAVSPISQKSKVIYTSYSASDKTHRMGNPYMLATRMPSNYIGIPLAKACFDLGLKKFAVLSDVSEAWVSMVEEFIAEMKRLGGTIVGKEIVDTKTVLDFRPIMTKFKSENPDVIFVCAYTEFCAAMVNHAREVGYKGRFVGNNNYNEGAVKITGIKNSVGILVETMYWDYCLSHPEEDKNGVVTYLSNLYRAKYPGVPMHDLIAVTWDVAMIIFKAMEVAGTVTDTLAICRSFDKAVKLIPDKLVIPHEGVLPSGMITGVVEFVTEIQPDGSFKKVRELIVPTEKLK